MNKNKRLIILTCFLALFLISNVSQLFYQPKFNNNAESQNENDDNIQAPKLAGEVEIEITSYDAFITAGEDLSVDAEIYTDSGDTIVSVLIAFFFPNGTEIYNDTMPGFEDEYWYQWSSGNSPPGHDYFFTIWAEDNNSDSSLASETFTIISYEDDSEVYIDGSGTQNWAWAATQDWFGGGDGSQGNPYIIENVSIDERVKINVDKLLLMGITIVNSTSYFIIRDCVIRGCEYAAIQFRNVTNGQIINNTCSNDNTALNIENSYDIVISYNVVSDCEYEGIYVEVVDNINISANEVDNNGEIGFWLGEVTNSIISGNTANEHAEYGIRLSNCDDVTITGNTANENEEYGIIINACNNTIISSNEFSENGDTGIYLYGGQDNSIIDNDVIMNELTGIVVEESDGFDVTNNNVEDTGESENSIAAGIGIIISDNGLISDNNCSGTIGIEIDIQECNNIEISGNKISADPEGTGIFFADCTNLTFTNNEFIQCGIIYFSSTEAQLLSHNIDDTNLINGKKLYYYKNETNLGPSNFTNPGAVILVSCVSANVTNLNISETFVGIWLLYCNDSIVTDNIASNNKFAGITLDYCNNVNATSNIVDDNYYLSTYGGVGIGLFDSHNCRIEDNNATNDLVGIGLFDSSNNDVKNNTLYGCGLGLDGLPTDIGTNTIDTSNKINDNSYYFYYNETGLGASNFTSAGTPGQIALVSCNTSSISNFEFDQTTDVIILIDCYNVNSSYINITSSNRGFFLSDSLNCNIFDCKVENSTFGIYIEGVNNTNILYNELYNNNFGIIIDSETGENPPENVDNTILGNIISCESIQNCIMGGFNDYTTGNTFTNNTCNGKYLVSPINVASDGDLSTLAASEPWCSGSGSQGDPYVIEGIIIMHIASSEDGISISNTDAYLTIYNCTIANAPEGTPAGLNFYQVANVSVINNTIFDCQQPFVIGIGEKINITGNDISGDYTGVYSFQVTELIISGNIIHDIMEGLVLQSCSNVVISNNDIYSIEEKGIGIQNCNFTEIYENDIYQNGWVGLLLEVVSDSDATNYALNNSIYNNVFYENEGGGIWMAIYTSNNSKAYFKYNSIYSNTITNHRDDGIEDEGIYITNDVEEADANYFEAYFQDNNIYSNNITDNKGNGIFAEIYAGDSDTLTYFTDNEFYKNRIFNNERSGIIITRRYDVDYDDSCIIANNSIWDNDIFNNSKNGIWLNRNKGARIEDNDIYDNLGNGIILDDGEKFDVINNEIFYNGEDGIGFGGWDSNYNNFSENTVVNNGGNGISSDDGSDNTISNNIIMYNTLSGIYIGAKSEDEIESCNNTMISYNNITGNLNHGIFLNLRVDAAKDSYSIYNTIYNNYIINNTEYGIYLKAERSGTGTAYLENNNITNNVITDNGVIGLYLKKCNNSDIVSNLFMNNGQHVVEENCEGNNFLLNEYLLPSGVIKLDPTVIDDTAPYESGSLTWAEAALRDWVTGSGIQGDPYVIEGIVIDGDNSSACLYIRDSDVYFIIRNSTFYDAGTTWDHAGITLNNVGNGTLYNNTCMQNNRFGIYVFQSNDDIVYDNNIYNNLFGIQFEQSSYIIVSDNDVYNSTQNGFLVNTCNNINVTGNYVYNNTYSGIALISSNDINVSGNVVYYNQQGIQIYQSDNNFIEDNDVFLNNFGGIYVSDGSENNAIYDNIVHDNTGSTGITLESVTGNNVTDNWVYSHDDGNGISLGRSVNCLIKNNTLYDNYEGDIFMNQCNFTTVTENNIYDSYYGIHLLAEYDDFWDTEKNLYCVNNSVYENTIINMAEVGIGFTVEGDNYTISYLYNNSFYSNYIYNISTEEGILINVEPSDDSDYFEAYLQDNYFYLNDIDNSNYTGIGIEFWANKTSKVYVDNFQIYENTITNHDYGIQVNTIIQDSGEVNITGFEIYDNIINNNAYRGITLNNTNSLTIYDNEIWNNGIYGLALVRSNNTNVIVNYFVNNGQHIYEQDCVNNVFLLNGYLLPSGFLKIDPVVIDNDGGTPGALTWAEAVLEDWCSGSGTQGDPYVIEGIEIDGDNSSACLYIRDSDVYFIVRNSTFYNSGTSWDHHGIMLNMVSNGTLTNNTCRNNNMDGIFVFQSVNNLIENNYVYENENGGITIATSDNNTIYSNYVHENGATGILLNTGENNNVTGNWVYSQADYGIHVGRNVNCLVKNNTIYNITDEGAIMIWNSNFTTVTENNIYDCLDGIGLNTEYNSVFDPSTTVYSINNSVYLNTITNCYETGIVLSIDGQNATINYNSNNRIYSNTITNVNYTAIEIYCEPTEDSEIFEAYFQNNYIYLNDIDGTGIRIDIFLNFSAEVTLDNLEIYNNNITYNGDFGIMIQTRLQDTSTTVYNEIEIYDNFINNNLGSTYGIYLLGVENATILNNTLNNNNNYGIFLLNSSYNDIKQNEVNNHNNYGIYLNLSHYNNVSWNTLSNNGINIFNESNCIGNIFENNIFPGLDTTDPTISIVYFDVSAQYGTGSIYIMANITDDIQLNTTMIQIKFYYPNGTLITTDNMTFIGGITYDYNWSVNSYPIFNNYNFTIYAYDNSSNQAIDGRNFTITSVPDTTDPTILIVYFDVSAQYGTGSIYIMANITDDVQLNTTMIQIKFYYPNGTLITTDNMTFIGGITYDYNWSVNSYPIFNNYNFTIYVYDNSSNQAFEGRNFTITDTIDPTIFIVYFDASAQYGTDSIYILANVTDDFQLSATPVQIAFYYPNGTQIGTLDNMTFVGGITYSYNWSVNSYPILSNYNFTIYAYDTSSNQAIEGRNFDITSKTILSPFVIDDLGAGDYTWAEAELQAWCSGNGTQGNPYIIDSIEINGLNSSACLYINNSIKYFIVRNSIFHNASDYEDYAGITLNNVTNGILTNNTIRNNNNMGIYVYQSNGNLVYDNTIYNNNNNGIFLDGSFNINVSANVVYYTTNAFGYGILLSDSDNNFIENNDVYLNVHLGIGIYVCDNNSVYGNYVYENGFYGIQLNDGENNNITDNWVYSQDNGIHVGRSVNCLVKNNTIYNITNMVAIMIWNSNFTTITENNIYDCLDGIHIRTQYDSIFDPSTIVYSLNNSVYLNTITNCDETGMVLAIEGKNATVNYLSNNRIYSNTITNTNYAAFEIYCEPGEDVDLFVAYFQNNFIYLNDIYNNDGTGVLIEIFLNHSAEVTFENLEIYDNDITYNDGAGIKIETTLQDTSSANYIGVEIYDNIINNNAYEGISVIRTDNLSIYDNEITNNNDYGIYLQNSNFNTIYENEIISHGFGIGGSGIYLDESSWNNISNNLLLNNSYGIFLTYYSEYNTVSGNIANNNTVGIQIFDYSIGNNITWNEMNYNWAGLWISQSNNNSIFNNTIFNNLDVGSLSGTGIVIQYSNFTNIIENIITNNENMGIFLNYSYNSIIYYNNFTGNALNAIDNGTTNQWDNGIIGNIWDDYPGADLNDNGIGDTPYNITGTAASQDNYPIWVDGDSIPPNITISVPLPSSVHGNAAPSFTVEILDPDTDSMWYTINDGVTNITFTTNGTISQLFWNQRSDGNVTIKFYAQDTSGNIGFAQVIIIKDTSSPNINIILPNTNNLFNSSAPNYNVSISDPNLDTTWYSLYNGTSWTSNYTFVANGTIDSGAWSACGNGTVTIRFYANDTFGNLYYADVLVLKDIITPNMTIISPQDNDIFGNPAPNYEIIVDDGNLDTVWYQLDNGTTSSANYTITTQLTGTIDQTAWDIFGNGTVTIIFYANDTAGNIMSINITVRKDIIAPNLIVYTPQTNDLLGKIAPDYNYTIIETNLDTLWYTIDGGLTNYTFVANGTINQQAWNSRPNGTVTISFYSNDTAGNIDFVDIIILLDIIDPSITINLPIANQLFNATAPNYDVSITEPNLNYTWYSLWNGTAWLENKTFSSSTGVINQTMWDACGNGTVTIRFYAIDNASNTNYADVIVRKDVIAPNIIINTPELNDLYGSTPPGFDLSIVEGNLDTTYYMLSNGTVSSQNIAFSGFSNTIASAAWDLFIISDSINIIFYANDSLGQLGFMNVTVQKDIAAPIISITYPLPNDIYGIGAPTYNVTTSSGTASIDETWYELIGYATNYTFVGTSGTIEQTAWNNFGDGTVMIKFYINNTLGVMGFDEVNVTKDITTPLITINLPFNGTYLSTRPTINITAYDINLDQIWYGVGVTNITLTNNTEQILDASIWSSLPDEAPFYVYIYAQDLGNNINNTYVLKLYKDTTAPSITIDYYDNQTDYGIGTIEVNCTITDYTLVNQVNITFYYPNNTIIMTSLMTYLTGDIYNYTWDVNSYTPDTLYYFTVTANDNLTNSDTTSPTYFDIVDTMVPLIYNLLYDADAHYINGSIYVNVSAMDNYLLKATNPVEIAFYYPNGTIIGTYYMNYVGGNIFNYTWYVNTYEVDINYSFNITVYDIIGNQISSVNQFDITDEVAPSVVLSSWTSNGNYGTGSIQVYASITDNHRLNATNAVLISFYEPDSTPIGTYEMYLSGSLYKYTWIITKLPDTNYYFNITARDASNNVNNTESGYFNVVDNVLPDISINYYTDTVEYGIDYLVLNVTASDNYNMHPTNPVNISIYYENDTVIIANATMNLISGDNYNYQWLATAVPGTDYYFIATAIDQDGNTRTRERPFDIEDNVNPSVLVGAYDSTVDYDTGSITLNATVADNHKLRDTNPVQITLYKFDNTTIGTYSMTYINNNYTYTWNFGSYPPGVNYYFTVIGYDNSSNSNTTSQYYFTIQDNIDPSVLVIFSETEADFPDGSITVSCNISDNHEINTVDIIFNASLGTYAMTEAGENLYSYTFNLIPAYSLGDYCFNISATDYSGNTNNNVKRLFKIVDLGAPNITINNYTTTVEWNSGSFNIYATVIEPSLSAIDPVRISLYYVNGTMFINETMTLVSGNLYYYEKSLSNYPLEKNYQFKIRANDSSGNTEFTPFKPFDIVDTDNPTIVSIEWSDSQPVSWPGEIEINATITDNYGLRATSPVQITFYYPDNSLIGTFDMDYIGNNKYTYTLDALNTYPPGTNYKFIIIGYDTSDNTDTSTTTNFEILDIITFEDACTYKGYMLKTPTIRYYDNPDESDYIIVISPLAAQVAYIEKMLAAGQSTDLDSYRLAIRNAINATLDAHPDAYVYFMDSDLGHQTDTTLQADFNGFVIFSKRPGTDVETINTTKNVLGLSGDATEDVWLKYEHHLRKLVKDIRYKRALAFKDRYINILILGDSLEFPEYYVSLENRQYQFFSDIAYLISGDTLLGGIGRLPINSTETYFRAIKNVDFEKYYHIAGAKLGTPVDPDYNYADLTDNILNTLDYTSYPTDPYKELYDGTFQYNTTSLTNIDLADLIVSGFLGDLINGPTYNDNAAYDLADFEPSLMLGYTNLMSNLIYYDLSSSTFQSTFGAQAIAKGVTMLGNTKDSYVVRGTYVDSVSFTRDAIEQTLAGVYPTIGQVHSIVTNKYKGRWYGLQQRILGDPALDIRNFDDPAFEDVELLPIDFEVQLLLEYTEDHDENVLYVDILSILNNESISSMNNETSLYPVLGGTLIVPAIYYYLEMPLTQRLSFFDLFLSNDERIYYMATSEASGFLLTSGGEVAIPNINIEGESTYPRYVIQHAEFASKRVYTIIILPALWDNDNSEFVASKEAKLIFGIVEVDLSPNASLNYEEIVFSEVVTPGKEYKFVFYLSNLIDSNDPATNVFVFVILPDDLTITSSNGGIDNSHTASWFIAEILTSELFYVIYQAPATITSETYKDITILAEYGSAEGDKSLTETITLHYFDFNLKLDDISIILVTEVDVGASVDFQFIINNTGDKRITNIPILIIINGEVLRILIIPYVDANTYQIIFIFGLTFDTPGPNILDIQIDPMSYESNTEDNFHSQSINVLGAAPVTPTGGAAVAAGGGGGGGGGAEAEPFNWLLLIIILAIAAGGIGATTFIMIKRRSASFIKTAKKEAKKEVVDEETGVTLKPMKLVCIVHRGPVAGAVYICPKCQSIFCEKCALALKKNGENCWTCDQEITLQLPGVKKVKTKTTPSEEVKDVGEKKKIIAGVIPAKEKKEKLHKQKKEKTHKEKKSLKAEKLEKPETDKSKFRIRAKRKDLEDTSLKKEDNES
ncbi:MAG: right-handed parallel beta-helix repeat-containing protein [Candidatus Neomarinimicrobiota bacterium]